MEPRALVEPPSREQRLNDVYAEAFSRLHARAVEERILWLQEYVKRVMVMVRRVEEHGQ